MAMATVQLPGGKLLQVSIWADEYEMLLDASRLHELTTPSKLLCLAVPDTR